MITVSVIRTAAHTTEERFHFGKKPSRRRDKRCQRCQCFWEQHAVKNIVTIVTLWHRIKFRGVCRECLFKGGSLVSPAGSVGSQACVPPAHAHPSESLRRTQNLPAGCIFDGAPVKSAFALLLTKVTKRKYVALLVFCGFAAYCLRSKVFVEWRCFAPY